MVYDTVQSVERQETSMKQVAGTPNLFSAKRFRFMSTIVLRKFVYIWII
jgi:hypothetical protein